MLFVFNIQHERTFLKILIVHIEPNYHSKSTPFNRLDDSKANKVWHEYINKRQFLNNALGFKKKQ